MLTDLGPELAVPQVRQLAENPASRGFALSWLEANGMLDVAALYDLDDRTASPRCCFHRLVTTEPAGCWRLWRWPETTTGRPGWPLSSAARRRRQPIPYWADRRPSPRQDDRQSGARGLAPAALAGRRPSPVTAFACRGVRAGCRSAAGGPGYAWLVSELVDHAAWPGPDLAAEVDAIPTAAGQTPVRPTRSDRRTTSLNR